MTTLAVVDYHEALARLRDAQARYALHSDPRADWEPVRDAIRDVLIARADLENIRRRLRRTGEPIPPEMEDAL